MTPMKASFLLVGEKAETLWPLVLQRALSPLGELRIVPEKDAIQAVVESCYDIIIVDARSVRDVSSLVSHLRVQRPEALIVVATASPTWRRAREVLQAGAADYVRKSLDEKELRSTFEDVLTRTPPPWTEQSSARRRSNGKSNYPVR